MNKKAFKRNLTLSLLVTAFCAAAVIFFTAYFYASLISERGGLPFSVYAITLLTAFIVTAVFNTWQVMRWPPLFKRQEEKLEMCEQRYRLFDEFSENVHFDADIAEDRISFNSNFECLFGQSPNITKLSEWRSLLTYIVLEDLQELITAWERALDGCQQSSAEVRLIDADRQLLWFRVSMVAQYDKTGQPVRMLGRLSNIDAQVRLLQRQRLKAMQDPITRLYHRLAAEQLVDDFLKSEGKRGRHAMLVIEICSSEHGSRSSGSLLLVSFSKLLKKVFRATDIIGRVGGNEFMVFLRDIPSDYIVEYKVLSFVKAVNAMRLEGLNDTISCRVGVAFYGSCCSCFEELYDTAEKSITGTDFSCTNSFSLFSSHESQRISGS